MGSINREKEIFWRRKLEAAANQGGSIESFCRSQGLSPWAFYYWRRKLGRVATRSTALVTTPFIPVEVKEGALKPTLPDPKWLAEFIRALSGGGRP